MVEAISLATGKYYTLGVSASVAGADRRDGDAGFNKYDFPKLFTAEVIMLLLAYTNALWNFLIYSLHYREFQAGLQKLKRDVRIKLGFKTKNEFNDKRYAVTKTSHLNTSVVSQNKEVVVPRLEIENEAEIEAREVNFNNQGYNPDNVVTQPNREPTRTTEVSLMSNTLMVPDFQSSRIRRISEVTDCTNLGSLDSPRSQDFETASNSSSSFE